MSNNKHITFVNELKSIDGLTGEFTGYAAVFGNIDRGGDIIRKGAFRKSLAEHKRNKTFPEFFFGHNSDQPCGEITVLREDDRGLYMEGRLWVDGSNPDPHALKALRGLTKENGSAGFSIGYRSMDWGYQKNPDARILKEIQLWEVSFVTIPMNGLARASDVKSDEWTPRRVEQILRDADCPKSLATQIASYGVTGAKSLKDIRRDADTDSLKDLLESLQSANLNKGD